MNEIIQILMDRDGMTRKEAVNLINETATLIFEAMEEGDDPEDVLMDMLGLEPDNIDAFLF